jgi:hypothetical protein
VKNARNNAFAEVGYTAGTRDYYLAVQVIEAKCDGNATVWDSNIRYWLDVDPI